MYQTTFTILPLYVLIPIKVPLGNCDKFSRSVIRIETLKKVKVKKLKTVEIEEEQDMSNMV